MTILANGKRVFARAWALAGAAIGDHGGDGVEAITIVVWDTIGNVLRGVQPWEDWPMAWRARFPDAAEAVAHMPSFGQMFAGYRVDLRTAGSANELASHLPDADVLVVHKAQISEEVLRSARRLRLIEHLGQDYRGIPVDAARAMGIPVAVVPLVNYLAVAEQTWAMILNHLKQLPAQRALVQRGADTTSWGFIPGMQLVGDRTIGLLGCGEIGRAVARIAHAFEMAILYWDIARFPDLEQRNEMRYVERDDLFRRSDILSVHLPLTPATERSITAREFGLMKPDALFVNTARGKLVDQASLVAALRGRRLGGAALDVFDTEPLPPDDPLRALHDDLTYNVTLTPHSGSHVPWTWAWDSQAVWINVLRLLRGEPIQHLV